MESKNSNEEADGTVRVGTSCVTLPNGKSYTTEVGFSYGKALERIKDRDTIPMGMRLRSWHPDVVIFVKYPEYGQKDCGDILSISAPYLAVASRHGAVPWTDTQIEKFAEWEVLGMTEYTDARKG